MNKLDIIAHRGSSGKYGDNNLQSIKKAIDLGCNIIEIDIRLTSDDKLVLYHDSKILINDNLLEIEKTKYTYLSNKICLLEEVINLTPKSITYYLDIKINNNSEMIRGHLVNLLKNYFDRHFIIASFDKNFIINYPKSKHISLGIISETFNYHIFNKNLSIIDYFIIDIKYLSKMTLTQLNNIKSKVTFYVYTVNNISDIDTYKGHIDGIVTDYPSIFINHA